MGVYQNVTAGEYSAKMKEIQLELNANTCDHIFSFYLLANNAFLWDNLPEDCLKFLPEEYLIYWGRFAYWQEGEKEFLYPCYPAGALLENGEYAEYTCVAKNGKVWRKKKEDIEICFANSMRIPLFGFIKQWADKCGFALSSIDAMLERAIYPDIIACKNKGQLDAISESMRDKNGKLLPFKAMNVDGYEKQVPAKIPLFDNREKDVISLWEIYQKYKSNFMNFYGVFTVGINKNERLTENESKGNMDAVRYSMFSDFYTCRLDFVDRVKKHFGKEIICIKNRSIPVTPDEIKEEEIMNNTSFVQANENKKEEVKEDVDA